MGVPKFFRYTSERYPCLNELVKQYQIPDFDCMYLDMNGIIHNCSHPDDSNPHFRITEQKIFEDIFHYLSILFQIIKPRKLFFMAIDGVAPRAKMNQQRGRRFRSAREAEELEKKAQDKGEVLPTEKRFDSNCITPGTVFMARLQQQLRYFVKNKISTDPLWSKVKVILSGQETPGEGEHKIMDYIRWARSQPDYDPNTRHCLYGLDADLIMLGMCSHEPHFALLREEVKFGKTTQRATSPEDTNFYLLHLSLLKEYLEQEFISMKGKLSFPFDIEKIVDDWVLMGFLVGNDFIPNLPNMHISNDALPVLYKTYMTVLPTLDGYINENGVLNLRRFEVFMQELAKIDKEKFQDTYADLKYFEGKTGRRPNAMERKEYKPNNDDTFNVDIDDIKSYKPDDELQALINATKDMFMDDVEDYNEDDDLEIDTSDEEATFNMEFIQHKKDYYMNKLDYSKVTDEVLASQAEGYVRAIQWNLFYYYRGCPSWCWYYPHHYAPYMSDIKGFADLEITFELGVPFKPFEQLLAVLPSASKHLLPTPFQTLMTEEESPIIHYYPINFETDLNGKKNDWEAVVLIPFIDEGNLLTAMEPCYQRLTEDELDRNKHGPMYVYNWTKNNLGISLAPEYFPAIKSCHASETPLYRESLIVPLQQLKQGPLPNATRDKIYPGFPTMRHLDYTTELKKCKVKVFDQPSRNENMMVSIVRENKPEPSIEDIAEDILGRTIWVGWPHLARAKVISVSNEQKRLHLSRVSDSGEVSFTTEMNFGNLHKQWISERSTVIEHNMNRLGIILGDITTLVHAVSIKGYKYAIEDNNSMVLDTEWCQIPCGYAYQAVLKQVQAHVVQSQGRFTCLEEAFPKGDKVFLMAPGQYYGCQAEVTESESIRSGRIKVQIEDRPQPKPKNIRHSESTYKAAHHAAPTVGITKNLFTRVTGCVLVVFGERVDCPTEGMPKVNLGLNLKFNSKNQEISGYTRRCAVTNNWLYSERCVQLVASFVQQFPQFFDRLSIHQRNDVFFEGELFPGEVGKGKPQEISTWLKAQSFNQCPRRECGSEALEPEELLMMSKDVDSQLELMKGKEKIVSLAVKWNLLYKSELHEGNIAPDPNADFKMYDRVVNVANNITVPLGAEGTITAIYKSSTGNTVRLSDRLNAEPSYQVLFDQPFSGAMKEDLFEEHRLYRMLPSFLLNISFGRKLRNLVSEPSDAQNKGYTNVLKRDDGNSAFANYSPTKQKKPPAMDNRITAETKCANIFAEDNGTELLKSLLQISEKDTSKNKKGPPQNWRMKPDDGILPTPQNKPQKPSWRIETNQASSSGPPNNRNVKNFPPAPQFANMPPPQLPIPAQIPFPRFQTQAMPLPTQPRLPGNFNQPNLPNNKQVYNNQTKNFFSQPAFANQPNMFGNQHGNLVPQFQQPNLSNPRQEIGNAQNICNVANQPQNVSKNPGNSVNQQRSNQVGNQPNGIFPKHLPNVEADAPNVINPSKNQSNDSRDKTKNSVDKLINPFVPLQVQTSQRRNKPPSEPTDVKKQAPANAVKPVAVHPSTQNNAQSTSSKKNEPKAKRKPRIAANLPFPTD